MAVIEEYLIMGGMNRTRNTYTWTVYMYETAFSGGIQLRGYAAAIGWIGDPATSARADWICWRSAAPGSPPDTRCSTRHNPCTAPDPTSGAWSSTSVSTTPNPRDPRP